VGKASGSELEGPPGVGQSAFERSLLLGDDHKRLVPEIIIDGRRAAAFFPAPLRFICLDLLPPFPLSSVEEDLRALELAEVSRHIVPEVSLVSRHDDQVPNRVSGRLGFQRPAFVCHMVPLAGEGYFENAMPEGGAPSVVM
jgi:hypothetical protein